MRFCCRRFATALGNGLDIICDYAATGDPMPRVYLMYGDVNVPMRYCPWCGASTGVEVEEVPCDVTGVTVAPADEDIAFADDLPIMVDPDPVPSPVEDLEDMLNSYYEKRDARWVTSRPDAPTNWTTGA